VEKVCSDPGGLTDDGKSFDAFSPNITKIYLVYNAYDSWLKLSLKVLNLTAMLSAFFYE
jgi:hypothetical protein